MKGKPLNLDSVIAEFQALAAQVGPSFRIRDAEDNGIWSCYKSRATGLKFNEVKGLAGLPFLKRAANGQGGKFNKYEPCKIKVVKGKLNRCLGILPTDNHCKTMVALPARLCNRCRERVNNL